MEPLQWVLISIAMSLLFVTFAVTPLQASIGEIARNNEKVVLQEIVSGINLVQLSPDGTVYNIPMSITGAEKCTLNIKNGIIRLELLQSKKKNVIYSAYIKTSVGVGDTILDCTKSSSIKLVRVAGAVTIT